MVAGIGGRRDQHQPVVVTGWLVRWHVYAQSHLLGSHRVDHMQSLWGERHPAAAGMNPARSAHLSLAKHYSPRSKSDRFTMRWRQARMAVQQRAWEGAAPWWRTREPGGWTRRAGP